MLPIYRSVFLQCQDHYTASYTSQVVYRLDHLDLLRLAYMLILYGGWLVALMVSLTYR